MEQQTFPDQQVLTRQELLDLLYSEVAGQSRFRNMISQLVTQELQSAGPNLVMYTGAYIPGNPPPREQGGIASEMRRMIRQEILQILPDLAELILTNQTYGKDMDNYCWKDMDIMGSI